ncbi:Rxt3-domain-containing protein [Delitschia confertaspora ATCC 74209]|uniref:Rxt3-domain-containing protein n=1 Tax=Delitschia confertaspora ATCC 74209 TaxID=1513339 RepID=A0A9P4JWC4_9PLEO|nr:Rxt3-domain-containing protein [Delitschia confertaspora ATCC 74209]
MFHLHHAPPSAHASLFMGSCLGELYPVALNPAKPADHVLAATAGAHSIHPHLQNHNAHSGPLPPSMSSSHNPPNHPSYGYDTSRRPSLGGASPPGLYGASSHDPPPPPSFPRPNMPPPPSSPQQQHNHAAQTQNQRMPFPSYAGARELPGLGAGHRPGTSMSISSIIGGESAASDRPAQPQASVANTPANPSSANNLSMQPPSPRRGLLSGPRSDFQPFRRQSSPERHPYPNNASRLSEGHGYPAGSPTRPYSSNYASPEQPRQALSQTSQPYKPMIFQSARQYTSSPNDHPMHESRSSGSSAPPRPNSQPSGQTAPSEHESRAYGALGGRRPDYEHNNEARRRTLGESHHTRPTPAELLGGDPQKAERERPVTVQPVSHSVFSPPRNPQDLTGQNQAPSSLWRQPIPENPRRKSDEVRREEPSGPFRSSYGGYPYGHSSEEMVRGRSLDQRMVQPYHVPPTSDPNSSEKHRAEHLSRSMSTGGNPYAGRSLYDQTAKSFPGLGTAARTGRASPLPQAVQGAQARPQSIGKDPSIKSEFSRMFSGLGSGLGASTPSRQSPLPQNGGEGFPPGIEMHELRMQRVNSQNSRKPKRVKDEEGMQDSESAEGRGTPSIMGARGPKRNKMNPSHHHHHHTHTHHHHHHHHRPDDEVPATTPTGPSASGTPFNNTRYNSNTAQNGIPQPPHHHHHHHPAPHHHHHAPRTSQPAPLLPPKLLAKIHDIQPILEEAAKRSRRHLGSQLYEASPELPKPNSPLDDQFCYASKPKPLPRFETNPINCTFTVRVPRYYLKPRQRQQIVLQRHLWGARIYRDDSDPIAAAIHSGWIRGEWDETVDVNMLDPRVTAPGDASDAEDTLSKIPAAPVNPPVDMELHITLLILPRLQEYYSTCEYGITSRGSMDHDGFSFIIDKIQWVEEGYGTRGQERGATALKRRLDAGRALLSLMNGGEGPLRSVNEMATLHA